MRNDEKSGICNDWAFKSDWENDNAMNTKRNSKNEGWNMGQNEISLVILNLRCLWHIGNNMEVCLTNSGENVRTRLELVLRGG